MQLQRTLPEQLELALMDMEQRAPDLDARRPGTLVNTIAGVGAMLRLDAERAALREVAKTFVRTAQGADLDRLAEDHFGLTRHPATAALGQLRLLRTTGTIATVPQGARFVDAAGAQYFVTAATAVGGQEGFVPVVAASTGAGTNRRASVALTAVPADWTALFPGLVVTTAEALAGGNEVETDAQFRNRIYAWWRSLRRGTVSALEFAALSVPQVRRASVSEEHILPQNGGWVDLYVTDAGDNFSVVLARQVREVIDRDGRAAGVVVNIWGAEVLFMRVRVRMVARAGLPAGAVARAASAVGAYINGLGIGDGISRTKIAAAAMGVDARFVDAQVLEPLVDLTVTRRQVLRVRPEEVTIL